MFPVAFQNTLGRMRGMQRRTFLWGATLLACERGRTTSEPSAPVGGRGTSSGEAKPGAKERPAKNAIAKRPLGNTGEAVSSLGLGGYHIGLPEENEAIRLMHRAIDGGMTFFDNSWGYHEGESERRMGKALRGGKRSKVFLMTKIDGRTYEAAQQQIDQCLRRLQTDHVDLMQIHEVIRHSDAPWVFGEKGAIAALREAKRAGKIRHVGFTGHKSPEVHLGMLREADAHDFRFDAVQLPLNVVDPHYKSFEKHVLPVLVEKNIAVLGMKPLGSGAILDSGKVTAEECLRYALSLPTSVVITGCDREEILDQALRVGHTFKPYTAEEMKELVARTAPYAGEGKHEGYKTSERFDSTTRTPHIMTRASY